MTPLIEELNFLVSSLSEQSIRCHSDTCMGTIVPDQISHTDGIRN
jgi:hypothetical protein